MRFSAKRIVPPLAGDAMQALQDTAMDDYSAACSGSENNAKNHAGTGSGSNDGFGEGKAVGVIRHENLGSCQALQILRNRTTVQAGRV
jgi:hypothetical protein